MRTECIFCRSEFQQLVLDLGEQPPAGALRRPGEAGQGEPRYPLALYLCEDCKLTHAAVAPELHDEATRYPTYSSLSTTAVAHAKAFAASVVERFGLDRTCFVVEIASNDGCLLRNFVQRNIRCLGVEPAAGVAAQAQRNGVDTRVAFWTRELAEELEQEGLHADLVIANNVLALVADPNGFLGGVTRVLKPGGVFVFEVAHLMHLVDNHEFDTIDHAHCSYFALFVLKKMLLRHRLTMFDVEELPTQGGSLRVYACHESDHRKEMSPRLGAVMRKEEEAGMMEIDYYHDFAKAVRRSRQDIRRFFEKARKEGKRVAGYGAPAKANTLLNYCEIGKAHLPYTVDLDPHKQGLVLPGSCVPIRAPEAIRDDRPDYLFVFPWNLRDEIVRQMGFIREWGGRFVVPIPQVKVLP